MSYERLNSYRIMWLLVYYDLPTVTDLEKKRHQKFRKNLQKDGFDRFQLSIYIRHCSSVENLNVHKERVKRFIPPEGHVIMMQVTDKQFGMIEIFMGKAEKKPPKTAQQLEFF